MATKPVKKSITEFRDAKHVYNTLLQLLREQAQAHGPAPIRLTYINNNQTFIVEIK